MDIIEIKSSSTSTLGDTQKAIITTIIIFILLKAVENLAKKLLLIGKRGQFTPQIWARSILLSEAWDPLSWFRLITGRTRYETQGGRKLSKRRPSLKNIIFLIGFLVILTAAELGILYGSLEREEKVYANSVKLEFSHSGKVAKSEEIAQKGCTWANATGDNFKLTAPIGICWANGNGLSDGFVIGVNNGTSQFFLRPHDSSVYIEVLTPFGLYQEQTERWSDLVTKAYLSAIIVTSSGLAGRVAFANDTVETIREVIEQHAKDSGCTVVRPEDNDSDAAQRNFTEIRWCTEGIEPFGTADDLISYVSGGFVLKNGGHSPWDGNINSSIGEASTHVIGIEINSLIGWVTLLGITAGLICLNAILYFIPGDDEDIAAKIVMERTGENSCVDDPTTCIGEQIEMICSIKEGAKKNGYVGTIVPTGYHVVDNLNDIDVE